MYSGVVYEIDVCTKYKSGYRLHWHDLLIENVFIMHMYMIVYYVYWSMAHYVMICVGPLTSAWIPSIIAPFPCFPTTSFKRESIADVFSWCSLGKTTVARKEVVPCFGKTPWVCSKIKGIKFVKQFLTKNKTWHRQVPGCSQKSNTSLLPPMIKGCRCAWGNPE